MFKLIVSKNAERQLSKIPFEYKETITFSLRELKEELSLGKPLSRDYTGYHVLGVECTE